MEGGQNSGEWGGEHFRERVGAECPWNGSADLGRGSVVRGGGRGG